MYFLVLIWSICGAYNFVSNFRVDYIITPLKVLQSLKESVTLPDEKYSFTRRLSPQSAAAFNFTQDEVWSQIHPVSFILMNLFPIDKGNYGTLFDGKTNGSDINHVMKFVEVISQREISCRMVFDSALSVKFKNYSICFILSFYVSSLAVHGV